MKERIRDIKLDVMKGILIIFMVWTHVLRPGTKFIESFNMPVFFMISGIFLKNCNSFSDLFNCSIKKIKTLYVYYITTNLLFLLFHNFFVSINFYTNDNAVLDFFPNLELYDKYSFKDFCFRLILVLTTCGGTQLGGATWFFRALLFSSLFYLFISFIFSKIGIKKIEYVQLLVAILLILLTIFLSKKEFFVFGKNILIWVNQVFIAYSMFPLGKILYSHIPKLFDNKKRRLVVFFVALTILLLPIPYNVNISKGCLYNPYILLSSVFGFLFIYSISFFIVNSKLYITHFLSLLGENTVFIVSLHLIFFKFLNVIFINIYHYPKYCIAGFPSVLRLSQNTLMYITWGIVYIFIGIVCPLILEILYKRIKQKMKEVCIHGK